VTDAEGATSCWCELAWLGGERVEPGVVIEVEGERIDSLTTGIASPPPDAVRLQGITIPGLANAHSHAFQRALRGRTHGGGGSFWTWREQMYRTAATLDPDAYRALARATFGEMALAGITTVGEFHYLHHGPDGSPYADPNAMGNAVIQAAAEAGIRITLLDACYLRGGIGEELDDVQRRFSDGSAESWAERIDALGEGSGVRVGAAIHSVRAVGPDDAAVVAEWAAAHSRPLHAHVSEQPAENDACLEAYGLTPMALLEGAGALSDRFTAVHATHLADPDLELLRGGGVTCCLCPTTERDLGDGIAPARRLVEAGARLSLGSDSHAAIDMFEEARAVELDERLVSGTRGVHRAADLLRAATENGHASLGWPQAGRLATGALADFATVSTESVRLAGVESDGTIESLVFAAAPSDVRHVVIGGRFVVRDGAHVGLDVPRDLQAALARVP
jgi:formiminoglutamate deiminase